MKKLFDKRILAIMVAGIFWNMQLATAQAILQAESITITLSGTSTLHDWEMKATKGSVDAIFAIDATGKLKSLSKLNVVLPSKSLKSEHTLMDNNTYKALKANEHPNITFELTNASITTTGGNNYKLDCAGKLTIAGTTQETDLTAMAIYNPSDNSLVVTGSKKMKMTDYDVNPPAAMLGTIKTADDITISFDVKLK